MEEPLEDMLMLHEGRKTTKKATVWRVGKEETMSQQLELETGGMVLHRIDLCGINPAVKASNHYTRRPMTQTHRAAHSLGCM